MGFTKIPIHQKTYFPQIHMHSNSPKLSFIQRLTLQNLTILGESVLVNQNYVFGEFLFLKTVYIKFLVNRNFGELGHNELGLGWITSMP